MNFYYAMGPGRVFLISIIILTAYFPSSPAQGEKYENKSVVKIVDGHKFVLPEDRPVIKNKGLVAPMPLDEYVSMKCSKIEARITKLEKAGAKTDESIGQLKDELSVVGKEVDRIGKEVDRIGKNVERIDKETSPPK